MLPFCNNLTLLYTEEKKLGAEYALDFEDQAHILILLQSCTLL